MLYLLVPRGSISALSHGEASELIERLVELGARRLAAPAREAGPSAVLGAGPSAALRAGPSTVLRAGPSAALRTGPSAALRAGPSAVLRAGRSDPNSATQEQRNFIHFLFGRVGWIGSPARVRGFLRKFAGVDTVEAVRDRKRASAIIEALKAICRRQKNAKSA
jgi:hypothetical protein